LHTFDVLSRARSLQQGRYIQDGDELVAIATELFHEVREKFDGPVFSVRLLGVRCSNFQQKAERLEVERMSIKRFLSNDVSRSPKRSKPQLRASTESSILPVVCARDISPKTVAAETALCPVCQQSLPAKDNAFVNRHVDTCLNGDGVRQAVTEVSRSEPARKRRKHLLTDFFSQ